MVRWKLASAVGLDRRQPFFCVLAHVTVLPGTEDAAPAADPVVSGRVFWGSQSPHRRGVPRQLDSKCGRISSPWGWSVSPWRVVVPLQGVEVPYRVFNFISDQPNGVFSDEKAARILGFRPRDDLKEKWLRKFE